MPRRRLPVGNVLLAVCAVAGGSGSGDGSRRVVTAFSAAPQPSTSWGRQASRRASMLSGLSASSLRHRQRHPCGWGATGGFDYGDGNGDAAAAVTKSSPRVLLGGGGALPRRRLLSLPSRSNAGAAAALAAHPPSAEEMDAEWEGILASDDDDDEEKEDEDDDLVLSDEELLATDATEGGFLGGEEDEEGEGEGGGGLRGGAGENGRRKPRVWYESYKARMKAEKARDAAWQEKRKTFSKAHNDYLDESQHNREIAAARYICTYVMNTTEYDALYNWCDVAPTVPPSAR